ncbi:MAG: glycine zipper family protein [Bdellovibrionota bacterium]
MDSFRFFAVVAVVLSCVACSGGDPSPMAEGAAIGTVTGAGAGAIIGNQSGHKGEGALIGAGTGMITGAAVGAVVDGAKDNEAIVAEQEEIIRRQQEEIKRQDREVQDLKRQQYHNESVRRFE